MVLQITFNIRCVRVCVWDPHIWQTKTRRREKNTGMLEPMARLYIWVLVGHEQRVL